MKKKKHKSSLRLIFILLALVFAIGGLVSIVKVASTSTESRSKAAEITSILKPSWEFNENGNSESWEAGNFGYSVTGGLLTGTTLGEPKPLPTGRPLDSGYDRDVKLKRQNKNKKPDDSGSGTSIANAESYLVNNNVNAILPYGLKGVNIRMAVSLAGLGIVVVDPYESVSPESNSNSADESEAGDNLQPRKDCTECKFGKFCPLFIEKIPGFCKVPPSGCYYQQVQCIQAPCKPELICVTPTPKCTPVPPPCEGPRCPKFPTVIPPGGWCPPNQEKILKFRVDFSAANISKPRTEDGSVNPPARPIATKPLYFDVIADGQMREYQIQFSAIYEFGLKDLKFIFAGAPGGTKISFDYIRLVSFAEIKPTIACNVSLADYTPSVPCGQNNYRYVSYICSDGYKGRQGGPTSCKSVGLWKQYAYSACSERKSCPTITPEQNICIPLPKCSYEGVKGEDGRVVYCSIPPPPAGKQYCPRPTSIVCPTPPTCSGQLIVGDPKDTSQCPIYQCSGGAACTQEVKLCSNGKYVSRAGPNCEFEACPE